MIEFFRNAFKGLFQLCVILAIIGIFILMALGFSTSFGLGFLVLIGGSIILIMSAGLTSTILLMDERLEEQSALIKKLIGSSSGNIPFDDSPASDWVCKKCNNTNRKTALFCNSCGEKNNPS